MISNQFHYETKQKVDIPKTPSNSEPLEREEGNSAKKKGVRKYIVDVFVCDNHADSIVFFFFCSTFKSKARFMCGSTPPKAIVARMRVSSSSSPRMASCRWRGVMRLTLRSLAAF